MLAVKGMFQDGVAQPVESIEEHNGQQVLIIFLDETITAPKPLPNETEWDTLEQLIENCAADTGIVDLAHQHNHYLYGKPKRD